MRIAFIDFIGWDYQIETVYQKPMGGSQSALCYLAEALAKQGHNVFLLNCTSVREISRGVTCMPWRDSGEILQSLDALIVLSLAGQGRQLRSLIPDRTRLILWLHTTSTMPVVQTLENQEERDVYDGFAVISEWQQHQYYHHFNIDLSRTSILRNCVAPAFCGLFPENTSIVKHKSQPPILAYTSTPFRGLNILLEVFPQIRACVPGTRLKVFSSMKVYQISENEDEYSELYRQCRETEGVEYIGSIPQPDLARELLSTTVLAYPNTYPETSCITVMEAMASGCRIVTSDLAALPETTAGFARLIPIQDEWEVYKQRFVEATVQTLRECMSTEIETHLRRQVDYINSSCTWSIRAEEWGQWLSSLTVKSTATIPQAYQYLIQGEYSQATTLYEQAIENSETLSNYWYLGLTYLLQGEVAQAQATWMFPLMNCESEQLEEWTADLIQVLSTELKRWESRGDSQAADLIRQQIQEIVTSLVN